MNRYENGKIYRITDNAYTKFYSGSACERLSQRMTRHRGKYTTYLKGGCTKTTSFELFNEFGIGNCKIEVVEIYPSSSKEELRSRDGYYIKNRPCINKVVAGRKETSKEYYERNKPARLAQRREYKNFTKKKKRNIKKKKTRKETYFNGKTFMQLR